MCTVWGVHKCACAGKINFNCFALIENPLRRIGNSIAKNRLIIIDCIARESGECMHVCVCVYLRVREEFTHIVMKYF